MEDQLPEDHLEAQATCLIESTVITWRFQLKQVHKGPSCYMRMLRGALKMMKHTVFMGDIMTECLWAAVI